MNIINQERAEILSNNNDAQETLENYLKNRNSKFTRTYY